jgi:thiol-disulfide isomerase/thioredoxin
MGNQEHKTSPKETVHMSASIVRLQAGILMLVGLLCWNVSSAQREKTSLPDTVEISVIDADGKPLAEFEAMTLIVEERIVPQLGAWQRASKGKARVTLDRELILGRYPTLRVAVRSNIAPFKVVDLQYEQFKDGRVTIRLSQPCRLRVKVTEEQDRPTDFPPRLFTKEFAWQVFRPNPNERIFSLAKPLSSTQGEYSYIVPRDEEFLLLFSRFSTGTPYYYQCGPYKSSTSEELLTIEIPAPGSLMVRFSIPEDKKTPPAGYLYVGTYNEVFKQVHTANIFGKPIDGPFEQTIHDIAPGKYIVLLRIPAMGSPLFQESTTATVESRTTATVAITYAPFNIEDYRGKHRLSGTLRRSDGSLVANTTVTLQVYTREYGAYSLSQERTDANGHYCFANINPDRQNPFVIVAQLADDQSMETGFIQFAKDEEETTFNYTFGPQVADLAPDFSATDLHGKRIALKDLRSRVIFLKFWATWCGPCRPEIAELGELVHRHRDDETWKNFVAITISLDTDRSRLEQFLKENNLEHLTVIIDGKGWENSIARRYAVHGIPATFIIDGDGKVVSQTRDIYQAESTIQRLLKGETVQDREASLRGGD